MKNETFTFRISQDELEILGQIALKLGRTKSDTIRWLILGAAKRFNSTSSDEHDSQDGGGNPIQLSFWPQRDE